MDGIAGGVFGFMLRIAGWRTQRREAPAFGLSTVQILLEDGQPMLPGEAYLDEIAVF